MHMYVRIRIIKLEARMHGARMYYQTWGTYILSNLRYVCMGHVWLSSLRHVHTCMYYQTWGTYAWGMYVHSFVGSYPKGSYMPSSTLFYIDFTTYLWFIRRTIASMGAYTSGNKFAHTWGYLLTFNKCTYYQTWGAHAWSTYRCTCMYYQTYVLWGAYAWGTDVLSNVRLLISDYVIKNTPLFILNLFQELLLC